MHSSKSGYSSVCSSRHSESTSSTSPEQSGLSVTYELKPASRSPEGIAYHCPPPVVVADVVVGDAEVVTSVVTVEDQPDVDSPYVEPVVDMLSDPYVEPSYPYVIPPYVVPSYPYVVDVVPSEVDVDPSYPYVEPSYPYVVPSYPYVVPPEVDVHPPLRRRSWARGQAIWRSSP